MFINEICCIYKILNQVFVYKTRMSFEKCLKIVLFSRFSLYNNEINRYNTLEDYI